MQVSAIRSLKLHASLRSLSYWNDKKSASSVVEAQKKHLCLSIDSNEVAKNNFHYSMAF